jgi:hypothetical protein
MFWRKHCCLQLHFLILKMEADNAFKTLVPIFQITWSHIPTTFNVHCFENLNFHKNSSLILSISYCWIQTWFLLFQVKMCTAKIILHWKTKSIIKTNFKIHECKTGSLTTGVTAMKSLKIVLASLYLSVYKQLNIRKGIYEIWHWGVLLVS